MTKRFTDDQLRLIHENRHIIEDLELRVRQHKQPVCGMCGDDGEEPSPRCETCGGTGLIRTDCGPGRHHMDNDCPDCGSGEEGDRDG